jgi:hypothetical protein
VSVRGWGPVTGASAIMAVAVCGMHYTGMAAMSVTVHPVSPGGVEGIRPITMIVPITILTALTIVGVALSALQAMTEEEFTDGAGTPRRGGAHAPAPAGTSWSLKQVTSALPTVNGNGRRPSPRPIPLRSPSGQ